MTGPNQPEGIPMQQALEVYRDKYHEANEKIVMLEALLRVRDKQIASMKANSERELPEIPQ